MHGLDRRSLFAAVEGVREHQGVSQPFSLIAAEFGRLVALAERLNQKTEALKAELIPPAPFGGFTREVTATTKQPRAPAALLTTPSAA
jgi:hypothetical protein